MNSEEKHNTNQKDEQTDPMEPAKTETDENQGIHVDHGSKPTSDLIIELGTLKNQKLEVDRQLGDATKEMQTIYDDRETIKAELNSLKQKHSQLLCEKSDMNSALSKKQDEIESLNNKLSQIAAELVETKNKKIQIRRIAKKYEASYFELKRKEDERKSHLSTGHTSNATAVIRTSPNRKTIQEKKLYKSANPLYYDDFRKHNKKNLLLENRKRIHALTEINHEMQEGKASRPQQLSYEQHKFADEVLKKWKDLDVEMTRIIDNDASQMDTIKQLQTENEKLNEKIHKVKLVVCTSSANPFAVGNPHIHCHGHTTTSNSSTNCADDYKHIEACVGDKKPRLDVKNKYDR